VEASRAEADRHTTTDSSVRTGQWTSLANHAHRDSPQSLPRLSGVPADSVASVASGFWRLWWWRCDRTRPRREENRSFTENPSTASSPLRRPIFAHVFGSGGDVPTTAANDPSPPLPGQAEEDRGSRDLRLVRVPTVAHHGAEEHCIRAPGVLHREDGPDSVGRDGVSLERHVQSHSGLFLICTGA
jgi:hypothetical protein